MITSLISNLEDIHEEVMTKLIPENIREDVTILNVTGTLSSVIIDDVTNASVSGSTLILGGGNE